MKHVELETMKCVYYYRVESETIPSVMISNVDGYHTMYLRDTEDRIVTIYWEGDQKYEEGISDEAKEIIEFFKDYLNIQ